MCGCSQVCVGLGTSSITGYAPSPGWLREGQQGFTGGFGTVCGTHILCTWCGPPALQSWLWLCGALHQSVSRIKVSLVGALSCM